jgi:hypothetical protein
MDKDDKNLPVMPKEIVEHREVLFLRDHADGADLTAADP